MVVGGSGSGNDDDNSLGIGENRWGEGGRGRTGKVDDVRDIEVKYNWEGFTLPSSSSSPDTDLDTKTMVGAAAAAPAPLTDYKGKPKKKNPFPRGEPA